MEAFCFKCRGKHELLNPVPIFFANGSPATQGTCANCGNEKVFKMGRSPAHEGMTPPVVERKPREKKRKLPAPKRSPAKAKPSANPQPHRAPRAGRWSSSSRRPRRARSASSSAASYAVKASIGHIRDLPKSRLGVDVEHDFEPTLRHSEARKGRRQEAEAMAKDARRSTSPLTPTAKARPSRGTCCRRLPMKSRASKSSASSSTRSPRQAIDKAFAHPREIDENAGRTRSRRGASSTGWSATSSARCCATR